MEISPLALVGIGLATMFFGYFFGLLEGRAQGYKRRRKEEPLDLERGLPSVNAGGPASAAQTARAAGPQPNNMLELARDDTGQPQLSLDGQRVDPKALAPAEHRRLVELMVMLRPWVEARAPKEVNVSAAALMPEAMPDRTLAATPTRSQAIPAAAPPPAAGPGAAPMSLVSQIDAILQARLAGTPLASRAIRLAESLNGGAIVFVGQDHYDGVADVPDEEVRAAIHAAIAEWERRYTPG